MQLCHSSVTVLQLVRKHTKHRILNRSKFQGWAQGQQIYNNPIISLYVCVKYHRSLFEAFCALANCLASLEIFLKNNLLTAILLLWLTPDLTSGQISEVFLAALLKWFAFVSFLGLRRSDLSKITHVASCLRWELQVTVSRWLL